MADAKQRSRLRPRFTLGALLLLITFCAPFLAYLSEVRKWNDRRKATISAAPSKRIMLEPHGHYSNHAPLNPAPTTQSKEQSTARKLWSKMMGVSDHPNITRIHIHDFYGKNRPHPPVTNEELKSLEYLPEVEEFYFFGSDVITDEGFAVLGKLPKLKHIQLQKLSQVSGEFLDSLPEDSTLETIWFTDIKALDGRKLKSLGRLKHLKTIWLSQCPALDDESLRDVNLPGSLKEFHVSRSGIGDGALSRWLAQVNLENLWIHVPVSRAVAPGLARQTNLQDLRMENAPLLDEDFAFLKNCVSLRYLELQGMPLRGHLLDHIPNADKVMHVGLNGTLFNDKQLPKLSRYSGLWGLSLGYTPLTGEGFVDDCRLPVNTELFLCGTRFSEAGKIAFANWNELKSVSLPSNWTPQDNKRFQTPNVPVRPSLNAIFANDPNPAFPFETYGPLRCSVKIDVCPPELMKPVADLLELGKAEEAEARRRHEAKQ